MFSLFNWKASCLHDLWINMNDWWMERDFMISNPILASYIHGYHFPSLNPSLNSSFHKNTSPSLLSKSNHLTTMFLSYEGVPGTPMIHFTHHSRSLSLTSPSKPLLLLLVVSCRNTCTDPVGALGHPVGRIRTSYRLTCSGLLWGQIVERTPRKLEKDPYLPPKPFGHPHHP